MRARWIRVLILVVVLGGGVITPVAPVGDARAAGPSGFVTIPDANVHEDIPVDQSLSISKEDLEGSVMVSDNASTTEIVVTTSERAEGYLDNGTSVGGGSLALVIQDDTNHAGREVAIPADAVKGAIGRIPEAVHGTHEDGTEWTSEVRAESGLLIFEVPHFSSNTVTFSGEVSITGDYSDGSSVSYDINSLDSVSNFSAEVTGSVGTENDTETITGDGQIDVAGNVAPGDATVSVTGTTIEDGPVSTGSYGGAGAESYTFDSPSVKNLDKVQLDWQENLGDSGDVTVYVDGTQVAFNDDAYTKAGETTYLYPGGVTVENQVTVEYYATYSGQGPQITLESSYPQNVDVSVDGDTASFSQADTVAKSASINISSTGTKDVAVSHTGGTVTTDITYVERSVTENPSVTVNGHTTSYTGTLNDGETVSLSVNESWIQIGANNVTVTTSEISADAPGSPVYLSYTHEATDEISVNYSADGWTETYNTSRTFASTQDDTTFSVPFQGDVTKISRIEARTDGSSWTTVTSSRYSLNGSKLTVQLDDGDGDGDIDAGSNISVRATGRYVEPVNGAITVTDPILPGEDADVELRIDTKGSGFYIDLAGVNNKGVRYTYSESWSNPESHMIVTASGEKRLKFPNAPEGGSARVTYIPVTVKPETNEAEVSVADPDEPTISLDPGATDGDDVTIRYLEASTGTTYQLYSTSRDRIVAKETADAGTVSFVEDDSTESLLINTSSSGGGAGGMFGDASAPTDYGVERPVLVMGALAALVIGLVWATGRTGIRGRQRWVLVGGVSLALGLLSLESLNPGSISRFVGESIGSVLPLAGIGAVVIVGYTVVSWWQSRKQKAETPETKVTFSLGDRKK